MDPDKDRVLNTSKQRSEFISISSYRVVIYSSSTNCFIRHNSTSLFSRQLTTNKHNAIIKSAIARSSSRSGVVIRISVALIMLQICGGNQRSPHFLNLGWLGATCKVCNTFLLCRAGTVQTQVKMGGPYPRTSSQLCSLSVRLLSPRYGG